MSTLSTLRRVEQENKEFEVSLEYMKYLTIHTQIHIHMHIHTHMHSQARRNGEISA